MTLKILALTVLLTAAGAFAQTAEPVIEQLEPVSMGMVRDRGIIPYARINELLIGLQRHGEGLFRVEFRIAHRDPTKTLLAPKLAVQSAERTLPVPIAADGLINLPVLPIEEARDADLASNQAKGSLSVNGLIELTTAPEALDMAGVRRIVRVANRLRGELLPWYARWLFPQIDGVRICSAQAQWQLVWRDQEQQGQLVGVPLTADPAEHEPKTAKGEVGKPCTSLSGQEGWPDAARLIAPADARLGVHLAGQGKR
ncbi:hypothetical protein BH11PSE10_BH11PSE10_10660 [soil metagenome]